MQFQSKPLTEAAVKAIKPKHKKFKTPDGHISGLSVLTQPTGKKTYTVYYRVKGKATDLKLGDCNILTLKQARDSAREVLVKASKGESASKEKVTARSKTLKGFLDDRYIAYLETNHKDDSTKWMLESYFNEFSKLDLTDITVSRVEAFRIKKQKESNACNSTINRRVAALKACLNKAVLWDIIKTNHLLGIKPLKIPKRPVTYLEDAELAELFDKLESRDHKRRTQRASHNEWLIERGREPQLDYEDIECSITDYLTPLAILISDTGLRRLEAITLQWEDIDLSKGIVCVNSTKTDALRYVPLTTNAQTALIQLKRLNEAQHSRYLEYVFLTAQGTPLKSPKTAFNSVRNKLSFYCDWRKLRRTFGCRLIKEKNSVYEVSKLMGHSSITTTQNWYLALSTEGSVAAIQSIDSSGF